MTVAVSYFGAVACSSAFCSTVLRPPSSWRHTGTKPECSDIAIRASPHGWWCLTEAILASGGLPAKRCLSGSATRRPGTWAGDVLDQLPSVLRGRGGEAARMLKVMTAGANGAEPRNDTVELLASTAGAAMPISLLELSEHSQAGVSESSTLRSVRLNCASRLA